jgi:hypothetical protein
VGTNGILECKFLFEKRVPYLHWYVHMVVMIWLTLVAREGWLLERKGHRTSIWL